MPTTLRILFIEDNESDAVLIQAHLRRAGYAVVALRIETAAELTAALAAGQWDLVLSDFSLPQFGSLEALQTMAAIGADLPFIIVSGTIQEEQAVAALRAGAHDFVVKDRLARLVPAIERELRDAEARRQRQEAVDALRASERRSKALIENSSDAISLLGPDRRVLYVSPSTERILGYTNEDVAGVDPARYVHRDDLPAVQALLNDLVDKPGQIITARYRFRHKNGTWRWLEASINNLLDEPSVGAIVFNYRDITERVQAAEALDASERRFRALIEHSADAITLLAADGTVVYDSPAAPGLLGYDTGVLVGRNALDFVHPDDLPATRRLLGQVLAQPDSPVKGTFRFKHKNGTWRSIEAVASNLLAEPAVQAITLNYRDITDRLQAETARKESDALFRSLFELMPDAIVLIDPHAEGGHWPIVACNLAACRMNGYERHELIGRPIDLFNLTAGTPESRAEYLQRLRQASTLKFETSHRRKNGQVFSVEVSTSLIHIASRELIIGIDRDITERKRAEAELAQTNELLSRAELIGNFGSWKWNQAEGPEYWSDGLYRITGLRREEFEPSYTRYLELVHPDDRERVRQAHTAAEAAGGVTEYECRIIRADGTIRNVQQRVEVTRDGPGQPVRMLGIWIDVTEREAAARQIERQLERLAALRAIDGAITGSLDPSVTMGILLEQVISQLAVDAADLLLLDKGAQTLTYAASMGFRSAGFKRAPLRVGQGRPGQVVLQRRIITDADPDYGGTPSQRTGLLESENFVSYYGVPLVAKGVVLGVLEIFKRTPLRPDAGWLEFLDALAGQAAIAIDNAALFDGLERSNHELRKAYEVTLEGWSAALDLRDRETEGHSRRVTRLTVLLAERQGLPPEELVHIHRGALLHDIGKMAVPDSILFKPGALTEDEWVVMRRHPDFARDLLAPIQYLQRAIDIPYCHHEKWDGTGYPRGLKGSEIPLSARIFSVVDVWDALSSDRPYRKAWPNDRVLDHIRALSGTHFDPAVVKMCLESGLLKSLVRTTSMLGTR
jgi:PAS domain S-box-containing protein